MKANLIVLPLILILVSCNRKNKEYSMQELYNVDRQFSEYSSTHGMKAAFLTYCDSSAVILEDASYPIEGYTAISEDLVSTPDSLFTLTWKPRNGMISNSGDLGYTYGTYTVSYLADSIPDSRGTYVTIWKRQADGSWKFVLDSGNEGLEE